MYTPSIHILIIISDAIQLPVLQHILQKQTDNMLYYQNKNYFHHLEHILSQVSGDEIQSFLLFLHFQLEQEM